MDEDGGGGELYFGLSEVLRVGSNSDPDDREGDDGSATSIEVEGDSARGMSTIEGNSAC